MDANNPNPISTKNEDNIVMVISLSIQSQRFKCAIYTLEPEESHSYQPGHDQGYCCIFKGFRDVRNLESFTEFIVNVHEFST